MVPSLRPSVPYDPRADRGHARGWVARLGRVGIDVAYFWWGSLLTLLWALGSIFSPGKAAARTARRVTLEQIFYTGFQGLPYATAASAVIGATIMFQTAVTAPGLPGETVGKLLVAVLLRELAPLVTAIIVAARSGAAIATELGSMQVRLEMMALSSLGIDTPRFIVLPRLTGVVVGVLVLTVYFSIVAVAGSVLVILLLGSHSIDAVRHGLVETLGIAELVIFLVKGGGCGFFVGWVSCHFGLLVESPTEVPTMTSRAVVRAVLGCVVYNAAVTVGFYWYVGPPIG